MDDARLFSHRLAEAHYPADLASVPAARHWLLDFCQVDLRPETATVAALLISELATNAVLHAHTSFDLGATRTRRGLRVEVHDGSTRQPRLGADPVAAVPLRSGGWGLRIVEELSSRWGVDTAEDGKTIWFELGDDDA